MNRKQEYNELLQELEIHHFREADSLQRAISRRRREQWFWRPSIGLIAACTAFILLVNFHTRVAEACSKVPVLRELAAAVTFHRSLQIAVEHDYVQTIGMEQKENGVTIHLDYVIADKKQLNVFFRVEDEKSRSLDIHPVFLDTQTEQHLPGIVSQYPMTQQEDALRFVRLDMGEQDVPHSVLLELRALLPGTMSDESIATFTMKLQLDESKIAPVKVYEMNRNVEFNGQKLTLSRVEVYATQLRVLVEDDASNTAWLKGLDFSVFSESGEEFSTVRNGVTATGDITEPKMVSFRADSPYFYDAEALTLNITGARWLNKSMHQVRVNLLNAQVEALPEAVELVEVTRVEGSPRIVFRAKEWSSGGLYELFGRDYYDASGTKYHIDFVFATPRYENWPAQEGWFYQYFDLVGYSENEVWLSPSYSHTTEHNLIIDLVK